MKYLRDNLGTVLAAQFRSKPLVEDQVVWNEVALNVLGKIKPVEQAEKKQGILSTPCGTMLTNTSLQETRTGVTLLSWVPAK